MYFISGISGKTLKNLIPFEVFLLNHRVPGFQSIEIVGLRFFQMVPYLPGSQESRDIFDRVCGILRDRRPSVGGSATEKEGKGIRETPTLGFFGKYYVQLCC